MRDLIHRAVLRMFPELSGGYHLPRYAEVLAVADAPASGDIADDFRPRYAVDLQVLDVHGNPDQALPVLHAVPLPVAVCGGAEMGQFGFPQRGTVVMLQFAYGSPNKPAITAVYPHGAALPTVGEGELLTQQRDGVQQRIDANGNMHRQTDGDITDDCQNYQLAAVSKTETLHREAVEVEGNSQRTVKGAWINKVLGAFRLAVGGSMNLSSADNMALTSASDLNVNVARNMAQAVKDKASLAANQLEQVLGDNARLQTGTSFGVEAGTSINMEAGTDVNVEAGSSTHIQAPLCYIGDSSNNLFKMVSDVAQALIDLATAVAAHTHQYNPGGLPPTQTNVPNNAAAATTAGTDAGTAKGKVDVMTGA